MNGTPSLLQMIDEAIASCDVALPPRSHAAARLHEALGRDDGDIGEIIDILETDPALTAGVLRVANSSFYGGLSAVTTVRAAVVRLGGPEVTRLALAVLEKGAFTVSDPELAAAMDPLWDRAVGVAMAARWLARRLGYDTLQNEAFIGGLLHDIGKLVLVTVCDRLRTAGRIDRPIPGPVFAEILDAGHCRHGAALLQQWGVPPVYRDLAASHHAETVDERDTLLLIVRLADLACRAAGIGGAADPSVNLCATAEAHALDADDILLAELAIMLEDGFVAA